MTLASILLRLRAVPPRAWAALAMVLLALALAVWLFQAGREAEREDAADRAALAEARAVTGRERADTERAVDTARTHKRLEEWNHAAEQIPDAVPDDRELRRRCRQLRDAGADPARCRGLEGHGQAGAVR